MTNLPVALESWAQRQAMARDGKTPLDLRVLIAWVSARENRAWYSLLLMIMTETEILKCLHQCWTMQH